MNTEFSLSKYYSKDNPFLFLNILFIILGIAILWKYRKSQEMWLGVCAMILFGMRMWAGEPGETPPES